MIVRHTTAELYLLNTVQTKKTTVPDPATVIDDLDTTGPAAPDASAKR